MEGGGTLSEFVALTPRGCLYLANRKVEQVAEEADSLKESLDKYSMRNQRRMLEAKERAELLERARAQRKALDVLNTVGLSNSVLRLIERRNRVDTWIKYVGMVLTVVIVYFFWKWTQ
ncbi:membrin-11 [Gossypium australe]|uniref:Membrin-11 n=1 Tax=Gossypium australe TaxID=47621 RepID=A0A5B6VVZ4_9ROSI|nr:membrin-11 [Gossypium australe]